MKSNTISSDIELVEKIKSGNSEAFEELVKAYQDWIFNIAFRMLGNFHEAEDLVQDILIKVITNLATYKGKSKLSTWIYRIAVNSILDYKKKPTKESCTSFSSFADSIHSTPDLDLADMRYTPHEEMLVIEETRLSCIMGLLLCLNKNQRIAYILGELFNFKDSFASEILDINRSTYRKRLQRAREDLNNFLNNKCGLINSKNRCICKKKTRVLIEHGIVDPDNLMFVQEKVSTIKEELPQRIESIEELIGDRFLSFMQNQPFYRHVDMVKYFKEMLSSRSFTQLFSTH